MIQALRELYIQKRRLLIILAVLLAVNICLYALLNAYLAPSIIASRASWNDLRQRVAVAGRSDVASVYRRGVDDLKKIMLKVPVKRQFPRVLGDILDNAASSGVVTGAVSYKPQIIKGQEELMAYNVTVAVSGSYAAVKSFLGDMQKSSDLIVVEEISLLNGDLFEETVSMELKLSVYLQGREGA
jgi:type IV pilus assembly protein PilO